MLDNALPSSIVLEVVSEGGTNLALSKRSRCLRHITSATIISARWAVFIKERKERKEKNEKNS
ncbi:MAG: hypothetical protein FWE56_04105 [Candidatus Bathyarchaeota archaeon]|nr:hypothetical protein [Candidatus Termiticorpusculum sp.]